MFLNLYGFLFDDPDSVVELIHVGHAHLSFRNLHILLCRVENLLQLLLQLFQFVLQTQGHWLVFDVVHCLFLSQDITAKYRIHVLEEFSICMQVLWLGQVQIVILHSTHSYCTTTKPPNSSFVRSPWLSVFCGITSNTQGKKRYCLKALMRYGWPQNISSLKYIQIYQKQTNSIYC